MLFIIFRASLLPAEEEWRYYMKKAEKQFASEQFTFALENYERVLDRNPRHTAAINRVARIYLLKSDKRKALEFYTRSLAADPRQADVQNAAGELSEFFGDYARAFRNYSAAIDAEPSHLHARINLVRYYAARHDSAGADEHFEVCARLGKAEGDRLLALGAEEERQGRLPEALLLYRDAVNTSPAHLEAYFHMIELFRKTGDVDGALEALRRVKEMRPDYEKAYIYAGHIYFAQRYSPRRKYMLDQTILNLEKARDLNPVNRETYFLLSDVYRFMGDDVKAAELLEKAEKLPRAGTGPR